MNVLAVWDHALDHLKQTYPDWESILSTWRSEHPETKTDRDLLQEYGWVVACCGMTAKAIMPRWEKLSIVLGNWDPVRAATTPLGDVLAVLNNRRKITAIMDFAVDLANNPGQMERLAGRPLKEVLAWMSTHPWVGANNRHQFARNLGWDTITKTGPVTRLAEMLQTTAEELCDEIAGEADERLRVVDLVLWQWGNDVGDEQMRQMSHLFRIL